MNIREKIIDQILKHEDADLSGECTDNPGDKGGLTKYGVTHTRWADFRKKFPSPGQPSYVCDITLAQAREVYGKEYFDGRKLGLLKSDAVKMVIGDFIPNSNQGLTKVAAYCELAGRLSKADAAKVSTRLTPELAEVLNSISPENAVFVVTLARLDYLADLVRKDPGQKVNLHGWYNRAMASSLIAPLRDSQKSVIGAVARGFATEVGSNFDRFKLYNNTEADKRLLKAVG